ncbi:major facilitator superfamily domain-containing protein [Sporodiniella umbellata]|nr:major facilitator superfamily domain-containing protein [Sporodiniella umbellata]
MNVHTVLFEEKKKKLGDMIPRFNLFRSSRPLRTETSTNKPLLHKYRSSQTFVFWTAAVGLFTSTFVHSILFPLSPFIVARIRHLNDKTWIETSKSTAITSNIELTSKDTGILVALYAQNVVGSPIFGWLGDKIKQRRIPMLLGTGASIAANLLFMLSVTYPMLLVARFLQGISNACVWTMCLCLIADNWPREHLGSQMGKLVGFYPLGMMVGLPAGGLLYSEIGYEAPFIASMILSGIDFFMRLVVIEGQHIQKEQNSEKSNVNRVTWVQLLKQKRLIVSLSLTVVVATVMSAFEPTLSMRLAQEWQFDAASCSLIVLAYMIPSIMASAICGRLCDRFGTKIVAMISLLVSTPSCILIGVPNRESGSFWTLIPGLILGGITIAGCQAPVFPEIAKVVDKENGNSSSSDGLARSYSLFNAAYGVGMCFGPLVGGYGFATVGFFWLCVILSILLFSFIPFAYCFIGDSESLIQRTIVEETDKEKQILKKANRQSSGISAFTTVEKNTDTKLEKRVEDFSPN